MDVKSNMDPQIRAAMDLITRAHDNPSQGRSIAELKKSTDMLKGMESQRLRTYCTSECMIPGRDLDPFGKMLCEGASIDQLRSDTANRITRNLAMLRLSDKEATRADAEKTTADEYARLRWGPTEVTLYNLLLQFTILFPSDRAKYLATARYFLDEVKVPVDSAELSGTTAISHAISTKPGLDFEYAQMLYEAGGDVNHRNRYGCTVAQEITQIWTRTDGEKLGRAKAAFEWFLSHGGNVDIADTDGWTVRKIVERGRDPGLTAALAKEDKRRAARGDACCKLCGREDVKLLQCGRCKKAKYCQPGPGRQCQKVDWTRHKKECKA